MDNIGSRVSAEIGIKVPWELVSAFTRQPRELPEDANRGAEMIFGGLRNLGMPAEMLEPTLFMSNPISASVTGYGTTYRAKPPAFAASRPEGLEASLFYVDASQKPIGAGARPRAGAAALLQRPALHARPGGEPPAIPPLALCTQLDQWPGDDLHFARASLLRGRNRLEGALHEACAVIDRALG